MQPDFPNSSPAEAAIEIQPATPDREPFWGYVDLLLFLGIGVTLLVLFCLPMFFILKLHTPTGMVVLLLASQAALYAAVYLGLKIVLNLRYGKPVFTSLGWRPSSFNRGFAAMGGVLLAFAVSAVASLLHTPKVELPIKQFTESLAGLLSIVILAVAIAPIFEELFFRGFLQPLLSRTFGTVLGILITAILFGSLHLAEYSNVWQYGFAITLVGIVFGYVRARSQSIVPSTIMHACFNSVSVIALIATKYKNP